MSATNLEDVLKASVAAVSHLLFCVRTEPEFRWHLLHTQSLDMLLKAAWLYYTVLPNEVPVDMRGLSEDAFRARMIRDEQPAYRWREASCKATRDERDKAEAILATHNIDPALYDQHGTLLRELKQLDREMGGDS